ncbi:acetate--CoA ligase family protein [Chloroflexota bacterium]
MHSNPPHSNHILDSLFPPRSIAIAGVSTKSRKRHSGRQFLEALLDAGFKGKLYAVNPGGGEIFGRKIYTNIGNIPDTIDYVISAVPARYNPQLLLDCAAKRVKAVHIYSAGFSEIANPEGKQLEAQITNIAERTGVRVIGPNCMGMYSPKYGLSFRQGLPKEGGSIGFISQSGSNSSQAVLEGDFRGIHYSKLFSYGNACDLDECDFLEYLARDKETTVIGGYIEGVKDGSRFMQTLKKATKKKPVIVYKAGSTEHGTRAVASHSGAIAGSDKAWQAALRQAGAIQVHSMEELVDLLVLFQCMSPPQGKATALFGVGGGVIIQATDECTQAGLNLPPLPMDLRYKLEELYTSEAGGSFRNPIDLYMGKRELIRNTVKMVADCGQIDLFIIQIMISFSNRRDAEMLKPYFDAIINLTKEINRRTVIVLRPFGLLRFSQYTLKVQRTLVNAGYPVFDSASRAATAIAKYIDYHQRRKSTD